MFIYNYRLFDRYLQPIATLVILGDDRPWWHPKEYSHELWGCRAKLEFPTVKLMSLPAELEEQFKERMIAYEEEQKGPYITSIERMGIEQGKIKNAREYITNVLQNRFQNVPETLVKMLNAINDSAMLDQLFQYSLTVESMPVFEQKLTHLKAH